MNWQWSWFVFGFLGGIASEVARWQRILSGKRSPERPGLAYIVVSLLYAGIGAALAVLLAKNGIGAFYIGVSWPVLLSGANSYIQKSSAEVGIEHRGASRRISKWRAFNRALFGRKGDE